MSAINADTLEPAYLLHLRRYRNTSALTELFTPNQGRLGAVVRGVFSKGASAQQLRSQLQLATPLLVSLAGRSELKSVTHLEAVGHAQVAQVSTLGLSAAAASAGGNALYCVMYVNELLVRLLPVHFPCPALFAAYQLALQQLALMQNPEPILRRFELQLLDTLGYAIDFGREAGSGTPLQDLEHYRFVPGSGFHACVAPGATQRAGDVFAGTDLLAVAANALEHEATLRCAKRLLRLAINHHLGGRPLNSRALFRPLFRPVTPGQ